MAVNHIVALSGGKDSTAMASRLAEVEPRDYMYICTLTGDELPDMAAHWNKLEAMLGKSLLKITSPLGLVELCRAHHSLPSWRMRFCTRSLKIIPYQAWIMRHLPVVSYVGLRADEEGRAGIEWDDPQITTRYPLREWGWTKEDVIGYLKDKGITVPKRTDCARCFYQTLGEWYSLWKKYPDIWSSIEVEEEFFGHTLRSPQRDTWPAALKDLAAEFRSGRIPKQKNRKGGCRVCSL